MIMIERVAKAIQEAVPFGLDQVDAERAAHAVLLAIVGENPTLRMLIDAGLLEAKPGGLKPRKPQ